MSVGSVSSTGSEDLWGDAELPPEEAAAAVREAALRAQAASRELFPRQTVRCDQDAHPLPFVWRCSLPPVETGHPLRDTACSVQEPIPFPSMEAGGSVVLPWFPHTPPVSASVEELLGSGCWKIRVHDLRFGCDPMWMCQIDPPGMTPDVRKAQWVRWKRIVDVGFPVVHWYPFDAWSQCGEFVAQTMSLEGYCLFQPCTAVNWEDAIAQEGWSDPASPIYQLANLFSLAWNSNLPIDLTKECVGYAARRSIGEVHLVYTDFMNHAALF